MQTFLPYPNLKQSVQSLDDRRLGKQRVEAKQILIALLANRGWIHHPIVKMWKGYENALGEYMNLCIDEWVRRGFRNNMLKYDTTNCDVVYPDWLGDEDIHSSHRANLLRKSDWYEQFKWSDEPRDGYVWVINGEKKDYKKA